MLEKLGLAGILGAVSLAVAWGATLELRLLIFALILAVFALAIKIDARRFKKVGLVFDDRDLTKDAVAGLKEALQDHIGYVEYLLDTYNLWSPEGTFTFPTGETFHRSELSG